VGRMTGANAIAKMMMKHGVEHFFHVPGGISGLFPAIEDEGIDLVMARSEKGAAYMADGFSRISFKPSVCFGQAGPGAINLAAGLSEPFWTCTPVIALTGSTSTGHIYKYQYQELDEMPLFAPTTKWNVKITRSDRAAEIMRDAFQVATSGCPGPVHVNLRYDASSGEADVPDLHVDPAYRGYPAKRSRPSPDDVKAVLDVISKAQKPVIVAGGGVTISRAWDEVIRLAETLAAPVATTLNGKGAIPDAHPLSIGVVGRYSRSSANKIVDEADVVFFVGSRAGGMSTDNWSTPGQDAEIVQLDIEPEVIGRNYDTRASMVCDVKLGLLDLTWALEERLADPAPRGQYFQMIKEVKEEWERDAASVMSSEDIPIKPHRVIKEIREALGREDILVSDTGQMGAWTGVLYDSLAPGRRYIRAAGTLGWSLASAIGAKFAAGESNVLAVIGDGGVLYHIGEIETALRWDKPFVTVVLNNGALGMIHLSLERSYGGRGLKASDFLDVDYGKVARSFGAQGERVTRPSELRGAIKNALDSCKPAVIDVVVDLHELSPMSFYRKLPESRNL
jgi:acetolactate synthase-1/2/3 large subunit